MRIYVLIGCICFSLNLFCQKQELDSLLKVYTQCANGDTNKVLLAAKLSMLYRAIDDSARFRAYAIKAVGYAEQTNWQRGLSKSYGLMGTYYYLNANYPKAVEYHLKALGVNEKNHDEAGMSSSYHNIGNIYLDKKEFNTALEYYLKSIAINEKLGNKVMLSNTSNNIGNTYKNAGDIANAIVWYTKSFVIRKELNDSKGLASSYINIGTLFISISGMPPDSVQKYTQSLQLRIKSDARQALLDSAYLMQKEAIAINEKLNNKVALAFSYKALGKIGVQRSDPAMAIDQFKKAYQYASEASDPALQIDISRELYEAYKKNGRHSEALSWFEKYNTMNAELSSEENQKEFGRQEAKFEYEKQQALDEVVRQKERAIAETARQQQQVILWFTLFVLLLAVIISVLIYQRLKISRYQNKVIESQKKEVEGQKLLVEEKQKEILGSINYAKRIQYTLLANRDYIDSHIPDNFILFQPKDIVSGDFYWATRHRNKFYLAVCDSTGHGVPGAFMSLLNISFLNEAINEKNIEAPNEIFDYVRERLIASVSQDGAKDGMDGILLCIDLETKICQYAAANNAPVLISNNKLTDLPKDKMPVGMGEKTSHFILYTINASAGDMLYLFTDGYADQFGGTRGKKFMRKRLNDLLLNTHTFSLDEQQDIIRQKFVDWKGELEQVDDVCIVGIKMI
jgi:serine phosphatase RsbU (regulator of sigma subunit)